MRGEDRHGRAYHLVLDGEDIFQFTVVAFSPEVRARGRVDEFRRDADAAAGTADAASERVADAELAADLPYVGKPVAVLKARVARDHHQFGETRKLGDDVVRDAVTEIALWFVSALRFANGSTAIDGLSGRTGASAAVVARLDCSRVVSVADGGGDGATV